MKDWKTIAEKYEELVESLDRYYLSSKKPSLDELISSEDLKSEIAALKEQREKVTDEMIEKQSEIEIDPGIEADFKTGNTPTALRRRMWSYGAKAHRDNLIK